MCSKDTYWSAGVSGGLGTLSRKNESNWHLAFPVFVPIPGTFLTQRFEEALVQWWIQWWIWDSKYQTASVLMPSEAKAQAVLVSSLGKFFFGFCRGVDFRDCQTVLWTKFRNAAYHMSCCHCQAVRYKWQYCQLATLVYQWVLTCNDKRNYCI